MQNKDELSAVELNIWNEQPFLEAAYFQVKPQVYQTLVTNSFWLSIWLFADSTNQQFSSHSGKTWIGKSLSKPGPKGTHPNPLPKWLFSYLQCDLNNCIDFSLMLVFYNNMSFVLILLQTGWSFYSSFWPFFSFCLSVLW